MRISIVLVLLLTFFMSSDAQTRRMTNPQTGRAYNSQNVALTPWPLLQVAERQMQVLDFEEAFLTLESVVAQYPESAEALILRARLKRIIGMEAEAKLDLQKANRINPYVADLYGYNNNRGVLKLLTNQPEKALQQLSTFQKLNYYYEYLDNLGSTDDFSEEEVMSFENVLQQIENEELDDAQSSLAQIKKEEGESAIIYDLEGILWSKKGDYQRAMTSFKKAAELAPDFAIVWYNMGCVANLNEDLQNAKKYLDKAIALQGNLTKAYFERAMISKKMGDREGALADYDTIIIKRGDVYPEALLNRGLTKKMMGSYASALSDLNKIIAEFPEDPELVKNRGNLYLLTNLIPNAIDDYTAAIELEENYSEAYYNRSLAHFIALDPMSACEDLNRSSELGYQKATDMKSYFCEN